MRKLRVTVSDSAGSDFAESTPFTDNPLRIPFGLVSTQNGRYNAEKADALYRASAHELRNRTAETLT